MNLSDVLDIVQQESVEEIALQFTDLLGVLHTLWIPSSMFSKVAKEGIHTDGSSLGVVDVSKSDVKLVPDVKTFVLLPKDLFPQRIGRVVCDIYYPESDRPFEMDPRHVLKKVVGDIKDELGSSVSGFASSEIEFFLFEKDKDGDIKLIDEAGYLASPPEDRGAELRLEMTKALREIGIFVEKHHHEVPHGKSEFNLPYAEAVEMADTIYLVKFLIKLMASKKGLIASFMPKPFHGEYGAGLHTHINLRDTKEDKNLFSDLKGSVGLSSVALKFMAGILDHARALAGITNPSVNSYKRLVPGWEAPVYISWANFNRSTLIRIPPGKNKAARLEYRPTDGSCNFYIAYAALLSAGLDGIKRNLEPPEAIEENIYKMSTNERVKRGIKVLPENLGEALFELSQDHYLKNSLGEKFFEQYLELKRKEWKDFSVYVHEWERKRYINV
ncbi:MAG: type I glutamate--ammonia ligase [Candidatus Hodarchaeales archaeon]